MRQYVCESRFDEIESERVLEKVCVQLAIEWERERESEV